MLQQSCVATCFLLVVEASAEPEVARVDPKVGLRLVRVAERRDAALLPIGHKSIPTNEYANGFGSSGHLQKE